MSNLRNILIPSIFLLLVGCSNKSEIAECDQTKFDCTPVAVSEPIASEPVTVQEEVIETANVSNEEIQPIFDENGEIIPQNMEDPILSEHEEANISTSTPPQLKYQLFSKPQTISGVTIYKTFLKILSMEDNIKINNLLVNRGRCSYQHFWGKSNLSYGGSVEYYLHCDKDNILEIEVQLADGRSLTISP